MLCEKIAISKEPELNTTVSKECASLGNILFCQKLALCQDSCFNKFRNVRPSVNQIFLSQYESNRIFSFILNYTKN